MMPLAQGDVPIGRFDIPGINGLPQHVLDLAGMHIAAGAAFGEFRPGLQKSLHFGLRCKHAVGVAVQSFGNNGGHRLITHENFPVRLVFRIAITNRRMEDIIALLHTCGHFLDNLTAVLLPLQLALRRKHRLDKAAFGRIIELEIRRLHNRTERIQLFSQGPVELGVTGQPLQIIENDDVVLILFSSQIGQQSPHGRAFHEIAPTREIIGEDHFNAVAALICILAAAMFLALQTVAICLLLPVRDPAVNHRQCFLVGHQVLF
nr:hypothetical protein [uncultured Roseobacter sp.]